VAIAALPSVERHTAFYTYWTRQEAYLKATGDGLTQAPAAVPPGAWKVETVFPAPGYVGALACEGCDWRLSWRDWTANRPAP